MRGSSSLIFELHTHTSETEHLIFIYKNDIWNKKGGLIGPLLTDNFLSRESNICQETQKSVNRGLINPHFFFQNSFLYTRMIFEIKKGGQLDPCWQIIFCQENPISVKRLETLSREIAVDRKKSVNTWQKKNLSTLDRKKSVNTWQNSDKLCQGLTENFCQQLTCQELLINVNKLLSIDCTAAGDQDEDSLYYQLWNTEVTPTRPERYYTMY